ncbi:MAG: DUF4368 domain-containing protein [Clostridiales bacterium]|nr:DUF4368 domain-containing protein [Clostridiales bacterium]
MTQNDARKDGRRTQRIQIFYNCIGAIDLPAKRKNGIAEYQRLCRILQEL